MTMITLDELTADPEVRSRAEMDEAVVQEYAEAMRAGAAFPPVVVFHDGERHYLSDGFFRVAAAREAGLDEIEADVRTGKRRDAILHAVGANATHGLRRTNADKRRAVRMLLEDKEWKGWSDRKIAGMCAVSPNFVGEVRRSLSSDYSDRRTYINKYGAEDTMDVSDIGKFRIERVGPTEPEYHTVTIERVGPTEPEYHTVTIGTTSGRSRNCSATRTWVRR
jgi:hypothetical protein